MKTKHLLLASIACLMALTACQRQADITFDALNESHTVPCYSDDITCFEVALQLEFPAESTDRALSSVRRTLITDIFGEKYIDLKNSLLPSAYIDDCMAEYNLLNNDLPDDEQDALFRNVLVEDIKAVPLFTTKQLLSYEVSRYVYTGGAHGVSSTICWVFDLTTGQQLTEDDIFVPGYTDALTQLLQKALEASTASQHLALETFYMDQVLPNGNFAITEEGIYYQFNPYDIAPYAVGETRLLLDKEALRPLMQPKTVVYNLFFADKK